MAYSNQAALNMAQEYSYKIDSRLTVTRHQYLSVSISFWNDMPSNTGPIIIMETDLNLIYVRDVSDKNRFLLRKYVPQT